MSSMSPLASRFRALFLFAFWTSALWSVPAAAQTTDTKRAERLFEEAREALVRGDYQIACERFSASYKLDAAAGTLLNLADCEERRGHLARAWKFFRKAQGLLPATDKRSAYALHRAANIEARIGRIQLVAPKGDERPVTIFVDDEPFEGDSWGVLVPLEPGKHTLRVSLSGHQDRTIETTVEQGEVRAVSIEPGPPRPEGGAPPPAPVGSPAPPAPPTERSSRTLGYVSMSGGLAAAVAGTITGVLVLSDVSTYKEHCPNEVCDEVGSHAASRARALGIVSPILVGVGAGAFALGLYLVLKTPSTSIKVSASATGGPSLWLSGVFR